jgi:hypothetical protein
MRVDCVGGIFCSDSDPIGDDVAKLGANAAYVFAYGPGFAKNLPRRSTQCL